MTDLLERLGRGCNCNCRYDLCCCATMEEAKDEIVKLREAVSILEDALQEAGDDYPGSKMQEWCQYMVSCARAALGETK